MNNKINNMKLVPVMLCFFAMGFVDLVGIASNYVKADLGLSDSVANVFPSMVFFWFLIFSVPTGMLMNRIGRKNTVLLSLVVTIVSLLLPLFGDSFGVMLVSFCLLGIGNALMQTSLNPLISTVIQGGNLASTLTFGQFIKAIASFLAPYIAMWGATAAMPSFGFGWKVLFLIYFVVGVLSALLLFVTPIHEEKAEGKASSFGDCLRLLGKPIVLLSFLGIMCHVGIDVGTNTTAPKLLMERLGSQRGGLRNEPLLHLPNGGLPHGFVLPACHEQPDVLRNQRQHDGVEHGRDVLRHVAGGALRGHRPCGLRQLKHLLACIFAGVAV